MLTDDDLTTELRTAFRYTTDHLTYSGRQRPRRTATVVLPLAAASLAVGAVAVGAGLSGNAPTPSAAPKVSPAPAHTSTAPGKVTATIDLAGYRLHYQRQAGAPDPLHAELRPGALPKGVTPVPLSGPAKAWVGKDPKTGENALYVKAPTRNDNKLFVLLSSQYTQDQLVSLLKGGNPKPVPLTGG